MIAEITQGSTGNATLAPNWTQRINTHCNRAAAASVGDGSGSGARGDRCNALGTCSGTRADGGPSCTDGGAEPPAALAACLVGGKGTISPSLFILKYWPAQAGGRGRCLELEMFEGTATAWGWLAAQWDVWLLLLLSGEAQTAALGLLASAWGSFQFVKKAILEDHECRFQTIRLGYVGQFVGMHSQPLGTSDMCAVLSGALHRQGGGSGWTFAGGTAGSNVTLHWRFSTQAILRWYLLKAQERQQGLFNRGTRFASGDKVLVLLQSSSSKLLAKWQGPFVVTRWVGVHRPAVQMTVAGFLSRSHGEWNQLDVSLA